jgi:predicted dehydrogenase
MDIGIHYVRAIRLLMGEPKTVLATRAMQINNRMSGEDSAQVVFSSDVGWQAHLLCSWSSYRGHLPDIVLVGDKGTVHLWPGATILDYYPIAPRLLPKLVSYVRPYSLQERLNRPILQRNRIRLAHRDGTGYLAEMQEFLSAVMQNRRPATPAVDARRDLEIILACYSALSSQQRISIP